MNLVATSLDTPYFLQTRISTDCSKGQQSVMTECWYNLTSKNVPIYNVSIDIVSGRVSLDMYLGINEI